MENSSFPNLKLGKSDDDERTPGNKLSDYKILCELGRGSYGVVNKVISLVDNNEYVLKKINMKHIKMKHQKEALKEAQILRKVKHPNIIRYFTSFVDEENLYIIMEYAEGGDLAVLIRTYREKKKTFSEKEVWDFAWELCNAVDYLHNNNIIHRDIKTLNIFLSKDRHVKLGDLGVSKIVSNAASLQGTRVGTPLYLSPELVKQLPYDYKVDIWALGCVIYHIAALEPPFYGDNLITLGYNIVHKYPKQLSNAFSPKLSTVILKFLEKNPSARPKISDVFPLFPSRYHHSLKHSVSGLSDGPTISTSKDVNNYMKSEDNRLDKIESNKANVVKMLKSEEKQEAPQKNESERDKFLPKKLMTSNPGTIPIIPISPTSPKKINNFISVTKSNLIREEASIKRATEPSKSIDSPALRDSIKTGSPIPLKERDDPFSKKMADTESTVENKPKNNQVITANIIGNDSTLSSKNIKELESQRKAKYDSNLIFEENSSKKQQIQEMPSKDEEDRLPTVTPMMENGPSSKIEPHPKIVRPQTSDPSKRIISSPIIKSTSPRIPIKGSVKMVNSDFAEKPPLPKQENIQSLPTEIRIRPVSANLIKRVNIPSSIQQPLLSNIILEAEANSKPVMKKVENNLDFDAIEAKIFSDQKAKAPLLERPKSAIFLNRIQTIANKMDNDENAKGLYGNKLIDLNEKFRDLSKSNAQQKVKFLINSSGFDSFKNVQRAQNKSPFGFGGGSLDEKEIDDPEYRAKQSWSRFEYLKSENTGPKVESRHSTIEQKVLSEAARPKTSTSNKRKLTIHDLA